MPSSSHRPAEPDERVHNGLVGLAGASASYLRGGRQDRAARSAVNAAATAAERGAQAVHREPGREARGSLDQPNERTSALKRARGGELAIVAGGPGGPTSGRAATLREMAPEIPTCWKRLAEARYARMKSYYTAVSTSAAVLVGMLAL